MSTPETAALLGGATVFFGFAPGIALAFAPVRKRSAASLRLASAVLLTVLAMRIGAWPYASVHLANVAGGICFVGTLVNLARTKRVLDRKPGAAAAWAALAVVLAGLVGWALTAYHYSETPLDFAALPLGPGSYASLRGGSSRLTNPEHDMLRELAAVDLVKLDATGNRAKKLVPTVLADYASFDALVVSPCDGDVVAASGTSPDLGPGVMGRGRGNYVVLRCEAGLVKLSSLKSGSVRPSVGAHIRVGQELGHIGSSGEGGEPHLHLGAFTRDTPLDRVLDASGDAPLTFGGHVLVANTFFTIE